MVNMRPYGRIVHRSLLQRELLGGIPQIGLLFLFVLAVVFIYGLELYFTIIPIIIIYLVMRAFTKKDPWLIDILIEKTNQKDALIP